MDEDGVSGYPWMSTIICPPGSRYITKGVVTAPMRVYLWYGSFKANNITLALTSSSFWSAEGARLTLIVSEDSAVYIVGGPFHLDESPDAAIRFPSSFNAPRTRAYDVMDTVRVEPKQFSTWVTPLQRNHS